MAYTSPYNKVNEQIPLTGTSAIFSLGNIELTANLKIYISLELVDEAGIVSTYQKVVKHTPTLITIDGVDYTTTDCNISLISGQFTFKLRHLSYNSISVTAANSAAKNWIHARVYVYTLPN
jgi:hypothetical protein